jgi:hypothetical protein
MVLGTGAERVSSEGMACGQEVLDEKMVSERDSVEWDLEFDYFLQCITKKIIIKIVETI